MDPIDFNISNSIERVRGLFCDQCGACRSLTVCSHGGCHIGLCVTTDTRTGCLNGQEIEGRLWFCPKHNRPSKIKYNINNIGKTGQLHGGRTLVPLLQLIIVPREVGDRSNVNGLDYITPHLNGLYRHYPNELFCSVTVYGTSGQSIHNFREVATEWMQKHPHSAILVTLIAHSTVTTGEIVYANPGAQQNRYASVDQVLIASLGNAAYEMVIANNSGMKGIISTACGYTFQFQSSRDSWSDLVANGHFDWILAFGAPMLVRRNVMPFLHQFVEYVFLREVDSHGHLLGTRVDNLVDSVQCAFVDRDLFAHTSVVLIHRPSQQEAPLLQEYVYSNRSKPWGYKLPACPTCGNGTVIAPIRHGVAKAKCLGCRRRGVGSGISQPEHVVKVNNNHAMHVDGDMFCWRRMDAGSPWDSLQWTV